MTVRKAGMALTLGGGAALGAGGLAAAQHLVGQLMPAHAQALSQVEHAQNNLGDFRERFSDVTPKEMALYEGIRQGLMAGAISGAELNQMVAAGQVPAQVVRLLMDVHDFGAYEQPPAAKTREAG